MFSLKFKQDKKENESPKLREFNFICKDKTKYTAVGHYMKPADSYIMVYNEEGGFNPTVLQVNKPWIEVRVKTLN